MMVYFMKKVRASMGACFENAGCVFCEFGVRSE